MDRQIVVVHRGRRVGVACGWLVAVAACCGLTACQGAPPPTRGAGGAGTGLEHPTLPAAQCAASPTEPGPTPIRRLNRAEYNRTVHDLLNASTAPAAQFPGEEVVLGFDNNAAQQTVSGLLSEGFEVFTSSRRNRARRRRPNGAPRAPPAIALRA